MWSGFEQWWIRFTEVVKQRWKRYRATVRQRREDDKGPTRYAINGVAALSLVARFLAGINGAGMALSFTLFIAILTSLTTTTIATICVSSHFAEQIIKVARTELNHFFIGGTFCLLAILIPRFIGLQRQAIRYDTRREPLVVGEELRELSETTVIWVAVAQICLIAISVSLTGPAIQFATDLYIPKINSSTLQADWANYNDQCPQNR